MVEQKGEDEKYATICHLSRFFFRWHYIDQNKKERERVVCVTKWIIIVHLGFEKKIKNSYSLENGSTYCAWRKMQFYGTWMHRKAKLMTRLTGINVNMKNLKTATHYAPSWLVVLKVRYHTGQNLFWKIICVIFFYYLRERTTPSRDTAFACLVIRRAGSVWSTSRQTSFKGFFLPKQKIMENSHAK